MSGFWGAMRVYDDTLGMDIADFLKDAEEVQVVGDFLIARGPGIKAVPTEPRAAGSLERWMAENRSAKIKVRGASFLQDGGTPIKIERDGEVYSYPPLSVLSVGHGKKKWLLHISKVEEVE